MIETLDSSYSFETKVTYTLEKVTRAFQELPAGAGKNGPKGGGGEGKKKSMGLPLALGEQKSFPRNIKQKPVSEQVASPTIIFLQTKRSKASYAFCLTQK